VPTPDRHAQARLPTRERGAGAHAATPDRDAPAVAPQRAAFGHAALLGLLRRLPLHALSRAAGRAAAWRLPSPLRAAACRAFARAVGADLSEVRDPLDSFDSLQAFFTRALAPGARPVDPAPEALVAPCDGAWGEAGRIEAGRLVQVKGQTYSLADLLGDAAVAERFEGGDFATFYLSPRDYHRFHLPCAARVRRAVYLPGSLWPVNAVGLRGVPGLFAGNERICAFFELDDGGDAGEQLAIAAVGATLVGKIRLRFDALSTNEGGGQAVWREYPDPPRFAKGEEWGHFEFGSTLVLAAAPGALAIEAAPAGAPLRLGERIGSLLSRP